jgi:hypothetical protein
LEGFARFTLQRNGTKTVLLPQKTPEPAFWKEKLPGFKGETGSV